VKGACSFYRGIHPFSKLRKYANFLIPRVNFSEEASWAAIDMCDILFMLRPFNETDVNIFNMAIQRKKPIIIDYDDDFMNIPKENPARWRYSHDDEHVHACVTYMINHSDVIIASTDHLANKIVKTIPKKRLFPVVQVIRNAIDVDYRAKEIPDPERIIVWRGSETHEQDIYEYREEIARVLIKNRRWKIVFIGGNYPWYLSRILDESRIQYVQKMDLQSYFNYISKLNGAIQIVPLSKSEFNLSKSNIAAQEAALSGCVAVVPDWPEWQIPGSERYQNHKQFRMILNHLIERYENSPADFRVNRADLMFKYFTKRMSLEEENKKRIKIIQALWRDPL
jgi:hypothetical protein